MGLGLLGVALGPSGSADGAKAKRPNILFIAVDDLRPQLGCYGHTETLSPNIDKIAAAGTVFQRAYCNVPVCGPSRVSVLTGIRTSSRQWSTGNLKTKYTTLPLLFKQNGYQTISNGKVLHNMSDRAGDWSQPPWRSVAIYHGKGDWAGYNAYGVWQDKKSGETLNPRTKRGPYCESADVPDNAYQDGKVADKTIADLKRMKTSGKPFFLACGFWRPHLPFNAPKKYWDMYKRKDVAMATNRFAPKDLNAPCRTSGEIDGYALSGKRKATDDFHRQARHAYYACVSYVDAQIGRVVKALDTLGLADNTIIVVWGDHGWNLGEHNYWGKHNTLNNSLHAPLIVSAPGTKKNNRTNRLVEFVDIYPSLCELTGLTTPGHVQGKSFVPLMNNPKQEWKSAVFAKWSGCNAVKTDRYLYTEWKKGQKVTHRMLFDHKTDPQENTNIAAASESKETVDKLSKLLQAGWKSIK
ncbi:MAG: sulfatase [Phycisphaerales bacterium]|nr:sulfatase [Phycisphaerales bacterium]